MKKISILFVVLIFSLSISHVFAQKIKLVSGDLNFLKGQTKINVEYIYDGMMVGKKTETEYINEKVEKYNKEEAGKGDKWLVAWKNDRTTRFQPKFEELLNKYLEDAKVVVGENEKSAKYTMIVKTTFTDPGYNVGVSRKPSYIDLKISFVETDKPGTELANITEDKAPGQDWGGYDFDAGFRIQESYAKAGKTLGAFLTKKAFK